MLLVSIIRRCTGRQEHRHGHPRHSVPYGASDARRDPRPARLPLLGNVFDIDPADPLDGFVRMAEEYGPIFKIARPGRPACSVSGPDLVDEVCRRRAVRQAGRAAASRPCGRAPADAGCSPPTPTTRCGARAHNILMAPFSLQAMRDYMPKMLDIADQLMDKWARLNPGEEVDVPADMTRLTLDTIALCGFGYRFNSFYRDTPHPFVEAMVRHARRVAGPAAAAADPDPAAGARAAAVATRTRRS